MVDKKDIKIALVALFDLDFGARYIYSFLRKNGYPTYIIFFQKKRYSIEFLGNDYCSPRLIDNSCYQQDIDLLISTLRKLGVKVVGISLTSVTMQIAKKITCEIKKHLDILVVWGGIHAIIMPEECIQYADIVCIGEGEMPMLELADMLREDRPITGIKNLWIKNAKGIEKNNLRPLIENLDELPFPDFIDENNKFLIDNGKLGKEYIIVSGYQREMYPIMTSRGCLYSCSYCCNSVLRQRYKGMGNYLRRRSVENVIAELRYAVQNKCFSTIRFWDDVFTFDEEWIDKFCFQYIREIGKLFICYTHPKCTNREILLKLKKTGLFVANVGIQSGSEEISKQVFSRMQSNKDILDFALFMDKLGVTVRYDLISDNPYETDEDQDTTTELLMKLPYPYQTQIYSLCWFPETALTKKALSDGVISTRNLEQNSSKALNNFHMYIPLSSSKRDFFWNCIKAMSVNRIFPKFLIRFCKKNKIFKKHPNALFLFARSYLRLFIKISLKWKRGSLIFIKKIPVNYSGSILYSDSDIIDNYFITGHVRWLYRNPIIDYLFFPLSNSENNKEFCLRIRHRLKKGRFIRLIVVLSPFRKYNDRSIWKSVWLIRFPIGYGYQTDVLIKLSYPKITFCIGENRYEGELVKTNCQRLITEELYKIELIKADRPHTFIGNVLFEA